MVSQLQVDQNSSWRKKTEKMRTISTQMLCKESILKGEQRSYGSQHEMLLHKHAVPSTLQHLLLEENVLMRPSQTNHQSKGKLAVLLAIKY